MTDAINAATAPADDIRTLAFDIGGVCVTDSWDRSVLATLESRFGLPARETLPIITRLNPRYARGEIDEDDLLSALRGEHEVPLTELRTFFRGGIQPISGTIDLLTRLRRGGRYRLISINNEGRQWSEYRIRTYALDALFHRIHTSCDYGVKKPDVRFFEAVLAAEGDVSPSSILFIDNKEVNLVPARALGMDGLLFRSPEQLAAELHGRRILLDANVN